MRFSAKITLNRIVGATSSRVAMDERGSQARTLARFSTQSIYVSMSIVFCSFVFFCNETLAQNVKSNAQNSSTRTSKVLSPEEATGTSLRDFNSIKALSSDYLENPDGGDIPVGEDDLWLPDLALGKKTDAQSSDRNVRVISYGEEKTTTEVRSYPSVSQPVAKSAKPTQKAQKAAQNAKTNKPEANVSTGNAASASYTAPAATSTTGVRQTQALEPVSGGFSDYSFESSDALLEDASQATLPSVVTDFPAPSVGFEGMEVPSSELPSSFDDYQTPESAVLDATPVVDPFPTADYAFESEPSPVVSQQPTTSQQNDDLNMLGFDPNGLEMPEESFMQEDPMETTTFRESFTATPEHGSEQTSVDKHEENAQPEKDPREVSLEAARLSESDLKKLTIEDIRISGLEMSTQQFNKIIKTRIGAKFNQQRLEEDKRALLQTKQFIDVSVSTSWNPDKPDKVIVNFDLTSRRMMRYIKVVGNKQISKHDILEELGVKPGESRMDPYEVENGRLRIIEFYKSKELAEPHVEILRGDRPEDIGVVYLIDEGIKQRVLKTSFVGNTVVSAARLRSLIKVKPGVLYFIGGKFTRDRLDADVETLLEYYRQLGYFDARIDREYRESSGFAGMGKDNAWVSVRYIIDEGPRYKIRNFLFSGNRVLQNSDLEKLLKVKRGSNYYYRDVESDRIDIRCKYQDMGYVRADITPNLIFTDEVGIVDIRYDIVEDHRYRVRDVIVDYVGTDSRTMTPVVLNMLDLTPGELLNGVKIRQSENTLKHSGYFNDKPSEGQLPEISVVPDDSSVFVRDKSTSSAVKEARRPDSKDTKSKKSNSKDDVTRGQITRGQDADVSSYYSNYIPYEETKNAQNAAQPSLFRSYAPSLAESTVANVNNITTNSVRAVNYEERAKPSLPKLKISASRPFASIVRGQTTIPSGFSSLTTREGSTYGNSSYTSYDSNETSQYSGNQYANSGTESYERDDYAENNSAAGFSAGVYNSFGQDVVEPISPEEDDVYNGDVLIKLQEGRTGMFTASIGVNSDYGLVGNISFTERNFNLFRPPTNLCTLDGWKDAFRGGGQIFNVQASPGTNVQSYRVSWDVPYVFHTKNTFGVTGLYGDHSYDEWFESRYGGEIRLGRQWTPRFSTTLSGGIYNVKIKDPQVTFVPDLNEALGNHKEYTIGLSAAYDTRNHPFTPSEGYLIKGTAEEVLGDYQFPRVSLTGSYYQTLHKRVDGSGRWILGLYSNLGWNGDDAPIYERYYGGGSTTIRGFDYRGVTPRYGATGFGVGGNFEFYNSAELLIPVSGGDEFQIATFVDTGTVSKNIKKWGRYRVAPGFGLRFTIPMLGPAPLALDFAFPINKDPEDDTEVFSFSMSGSR